MGRGKNRELLFKKYRAKKKKYRASVLQDEKKYGDELRQWLHNSVSVCDITGL